MEADASGPKYLVMKRSRARLEILVDDLANPPPRVAHTACTSGPGGRPGWRRVPLTALMAVG